LADGNNVLVVDNFSTGRRENIAHHAVYGHIQVSDDDITDQSSMEFLFHDFCPEIVCHQAAQASLLRSHQEPVLDAEINTLGTLRLMKLAEEYECKKFVFASTSAVFGGSKSLHFREGDETFPVSPYGISKCAAELYLKTSKIPTTIIRYGNVYGPRQIPVGENQLIARLLNHLYRKGDFKIYGDGSHRRDFVYVDDIARANFAAMFSDITGVVHAGTGNSRSVMEIVRIVCEKTGKHNPALLEKGPEIAEPTISALGTIRADWSALWSPLTTLEQGIQKTVDWWKVEA